MSCEFMFYIGRMTTGARTAIFWILLLTEKPSAPRISYKKSKKWGKENDFDGDTLCCISIDSDDVQHIVNILENHNGTKGIITKIILNSKH